MQLLMVLLGGALGSGSRFLFCSLAQRWFGEQFAWGTAGVNLAGCLVIGFLYALAEKELIAPELRLFLMTGFLGGLTTFSTYALESVNYFSTRQMGLAFLNLAVNNMGGFAMVLLGRWLGRS